MATKMGMKRTIPQLPLRRTKGLGKISPKQRIRIIVLSKIEPPADGLCEKCKHPPDFRNLQKHHIIKRSHCGSDDRSNIIWLCGICPSAEHHVVEQ